MSARFYKILVTVFLAHLFVLNLIWVGFSAPFPKPPANFIFEGALASQDTFSVQEDVWQKGSAPDLLAVDHHESSYLDNWHTLREPTKPKFN